MGSDDLYHKRKARQTTKLQRSKAKRSSYDVVLIVCEGAKTEPFYLKGIRDFFRLNNANIKICGKECGTDPLSIVNFAIETYKKDPIFDRVYCVFDRDRHVTFNTALEKVRLTRLPHGGKLFAVPSVPCFEYWLILHYKFTTKPYAATGCSSVCDQVIRGLKKHIGGYDKGNQDIFLITKDKLDTAIANSKSVKKFHETSGTDNPSTLMHELVEYLRELKK